MKLPVEFLNKMRNLMHEEEYPAFLESFDQPRYYGLRANTLKVDVNEFLRASPFELEPIPWTKDGFYYREGASPGKHPYYHAGLYYIQEPSAMLPGAVMDAQPGDRVLDLCAAPGGKTVQMAAGMQGSGLLVANDINVDRVKALVKNIELCGIRNAVVTNETPDKLARKFSGYFNKILIDAPCSGEGMFRKDEEAARSWENFKCEKCAGMQWEILQHVNQMLKPGGHIVYSTCTFSPEEDERMISRFLDNFNNYEILDIPKTAGIENGRPEWGNHHPELAKTARLWPHRLKGEGHFVALLRKKPIEDAYGVSDDSVQSTVPELSMQAFHTFVANHLNIKIHGNFYMKGTNLYCLPVEMPDLGGLKVAKFGWYLGETLMVEGEKGYTAVCVDGFTLGWAKQTGDMLKNLYPKGWRKMS